MWSRISCTSEECQTIRNRSLVIEPARRYEVGQILELCSGKESSFGRVSQVMTSGSYQIEPCIDLATLSCLVRLGGNFDRDYLDIGLFLSLGTEVQPYWLEVLFRQAGVPMQDIESIKIPKKSIEQLARVRKIDMMEAKSYLEEEMLEKWEKVIEKVVTELKSRLAEMTLKDRPGFLPTPHGNLVTIQTGKLNKISHREADGTEWFTTFCSIDPGRQLRVMVSTVVEWISICQMLLGFDSLDDTMDTAHHLTSVLLVDDTLVVCYDRHKYQC